MLDGSETIALAARRDVAVHYMHTKNILDEMATELWSAVWVQRPAASRLHREAGGGGTR